MAARSIVVSDETVRAWGLRFGRQFANEMKRRRPKPGDKWRLDEAFIRIDNKQQYPWRVVTRTGMCWTSWSFRTLRRGLHYVPWVVVTDKLRSCAAAKRKILPASSVGKVNT